jgi:hypothetical protein
MKAAYKALKASDCWDWLTRDEMQHIAAIALKDARRSCRLPPGETWTDGGAPWSDPATFTETLIRLLTLRVRAHAHGAGIAGHEEAPAHLARLRSFAERKGGPA